MRRREADVRVMQGQEAENAGSLKELEKKGKKRGRDSPLEPQKERGPAEPFQTSALQNREIINVYCFKPLTV